MINATGQLGTGSHLRVEHEARAAQASLRSERWVAEGWRRLEVIQRGGDGLESKKLGATPHAAYRLHLIGHTQLAKRAHILA